ncbi:type-1 angiotensin II receptor-associated protein-like [Lytechinus variegatus]|uniref:type-1 angiotensin II receptor-associated protein-like n=1 Tax=Lytechinus variegatus TaxID=7654 RepID=UPI001BB294D1|nr:type-1 angiotensin II receptor-associated protein-like [Lytechinus variegatus]
MQPEATENQSPRQQSPSEFLTMGLVDKFALKVVVGVQFVLTVWASMGGWIDSGYVYMNSIILITGLMAIMMPESPESVFMMLIFEILSILMDIIFLGIYFPRIHCVEVNCSTMRFGAGMCILNLLLKPVAIYLLFREYNRRGGDYGDLNFPNPTVRGYENIDQSLPTNNQVEEAHPPASIDKPYTPLPQ